MTSIPQYIEIPFPSEQILASVSDSVEKVEKKKKPDDNATIISLKLQHVMI